MNSYFEKDDVIKLYHISTVDLGESYTFIPRIPANRSLHEDDFTPRVCLSTSVNGAITAIATELNLDEPIDLVIYSTELHETDKNIVPYTQLYNDNKVCDALATEECWYLKPITMTSIKDTVTVTNTNRVKIIPSIAGYELNRAIMSLGLVDNNYMFKYIGCNPYSLLNAYLPKDKILGRYINDILDRLYQLSGIEVYYIEKITETISVTISKDCDSNRIHEPDTYYENLNKYLQPHLHYNNPVTFYKEV